MKDTAIKTITRQFKVCKLLLVFSLIFWFVETTYFIHQYGWHKQAINDNEAICDAIVKNVLLVAVFIFINVVWNLVSEILTALNDEE